MCLKHLACSRCSVSVYSGSQGVFEEVNGRTVGSDFMCGLGGFGECREAAGKGTTIYCVPTVYRVLNLHDPAEIRVRGREPPLHSSNLTGLEAGGPCVSIWGDFTFQDGA